MYQFNEEYLQNYISKKIANHSPLNETQIKVLVESFTSPINTLLDYTWQNDLEKSINILNSLKDINEKKTESSKKQLISFMLEWLKTESTQRIELLKRSDDLMRELPICIKICSGNIEGVTSNLHLELLGGEIKYGTEIIYRCLSRRQTIEAQSIISDLLIEVLTHANRELTRRATLIETEEEQKASVIKRTSCLCQ